MYGIANRTIHFFGQGYGFEPARILVKLDNSEIFSGEIPTINQETFNMIPEDQTVIFLCELPITTQRLVPMSIDVISGTVVFAQITATHCFDNCESIFFPVCAGSDARKNVKIDGVAQTTTQDLPGTWSWTVNAGSNLSYDLDLR